MPLQENRFHKKGYGRIFVDKQENVPAVLKAIEAVDDFEADYLPVNFVTAWENRPDDLLYTHKFEIDINALTNYCWQQGIFIWCVSQGRNPAELI